MQLILNSPVTEAAEQTYLILVDDLFISEVSDRHLTGRRLSNVMLRPLAGLAGVKEVTQALVINFDETCCECELR